MGTDWILPVVPSGDDIKLFIVFDSDRYLVVVVVCLKLQFGIVVPTQLFVEHVKGFHVLV